MIASSSEVYGLENKKFYENDVTQLETHLF